MLSSLKPEDVSVDPLSLLDNLIRPSEPATILCPVIDAEGKISDVVEYLRDAGEFGASTVSMALKRLGDFTTLSDRAATLSTTQLFKITGE